MCRQVNTVGHKRWVREDHKGPADEEGVSRPVHNFFFASVGWLVGWLGVVWLSSNGRRPAGGRVMGKREGESG